MNLPRYNWSFYCWIAIIICFHHAVSGEDEINNGPDEPPEIPADEEEDDDDKTSIIDGSSAEKIAQTPISILLGNIDETADPCDNFYKYACGNWMANNQIPQDQARLTLFDVVRNRVMDQMKDQLAAIRSKPVLESLSQLRARSSQIVTVDSPEFSELMVYLVKNYNVFPFWALGVKIDDKNSSRYVLKLEDVELSLGSRPYYLEQALYEDRIMALKRYITDTNDVLAEDALDLGEAGPNSLDYLKVDPDAYVAFETKIAKAKLPEYDMRNHTNLYNMWSVSQLKAQIPIMNWDNYFDADFAPDVRATVNDNTEVMVLRPHFQSLFLDIIRESDISEVINYIKWILIASQTEALDERFRPIRLRFLEAVAGTKELQPRWKKCVTAAENLQQAASALYVNAYFSESDKQDTTEVIGNILASLESTIEELDWMDEETKSAALDKLASVHRDIGYQEISRDMAALDAYYAELNLQPSDQYIELQRKIHRFRRTKIQQKLLYPVNKDELEEAFVVNAFYTRTLNLVTFPAAIWQAPFYDRNFPRPMKYGAIGSVIGHELTHGFDDQGAQYDKNGNLRNWWSDESEKRFNRKKQCIISQYSRYRIEQVDRKINGIRTQGENIADNGGVKIAFEAYKRADQTATNIEEASSSFSNDQLFFIAYASTWCALYRPEYTIKHILADSHSHPEFRVIGPLSNLEEFAESFSCKSGTTMNPGQEQQAKCMVW